MGMSKAELDKLPKAVREHIEAIEAQNALLAKAGQGKLTPKVSEKGAVSIYGLGKWPVTLYQEQMTRLLNAADEIRAFMKAHAGELKTKAQSLVDQAAVAPAGNDKK